MTSAAVFPNWQSVRQEWRKWNLDFAAPMLYHNFYYGDIAWIGERTKEEIKDLVVQKPIYSGLFVPALSPSELEQAVTVSMKAGAAGVSLFDLGTMDDAKWKSFKAATKSVK